MSRWGRLLVLIVVLPGLHGCGGPRADTSSPEASFTSLRTMYAALPANRRDELRWALEVVASDELNDRVRRRSSRWRASAAPVRITRIRSVTIRFSYMFLVHVLVRATRR